LRSWLSVLLLALSLPCNALTPYEAVYSIHFGPFHLGDGNYRLQQREDASYLFTFSSKLSLLLLSDKREISSEFSLLNQQIISRNFKQQRTGVGKDFLETIHWDPHKKISSQFNQDTFTTHWQRQVFDPLNAQLQIRLDLINHQREFSYALLMNNTLDDYIWLNRGEEILTINDIGYRAVKFEMQRDTSKRQTFTWFALDMDYLPLRVLYAIKGTGSIDMKLKSYRQLEPLSPLVRPSNSRSGL
jgi:hypothetical protein